MSLKGFFTSRKGQVVQIGLAMTVGFALAVGVLATGGSWVPQKTVLAEEKPIVVPASVFETQNTFRAITKAVLPSVVEIQTEGPATQSNDQRSVPPFEFFFGPQNPNSTPEKPSEPEGKTPRTPRLPKATGLGSGVMIQRQGEKVFILTNNHVIDKADKITVKLSDDREYDATLVGPMLAATWPWCPSRPRRPTWSWPSSGTPTSFRWETGSSPWATPWVWSSR